MTTSAFDPRLIEKYSKPKSLLHFQWGDDNKVYRYCLVEIIDEKEALSKYGSSDSGASLGEIFGSILKKKE